MFIFNEYGTELFILLWCHAIDPRLLEPLRWDRWDIMQRKNCTGRLSRYVGKWLLFYVASNSRRTEMSFYIAAEPWTLHSIFKRREENQLDATEWFIALMICSTCFGNLYAHHQVLETILVLLPHMVGNALFAGGRRSGAGRQAMLPGWGKLLERMR